MIQVKQTKGLENIVGLVVVAAIIIIGIMMFKGMKFFGDTLDGVKGVFGAGKEDKAATKAIDVAVANLKRAGAKNPFDRRFNLQFKGKKISALTKNSTDAVAKRIFSAVGKIYDSPQKLAGEFSALKTQTQVAHMADAFYRIYKLDLLSWMTEKMDTLNQKRILKSIIDRVLSLPVGVSNYEGEVANEHIEFFKKFSKGYDGNDAAASSYMRYVTKINRSKPSMRQQAPAPQQGQISPSKTRFRYDGDTV